MPCYSCPKCLADVEFDHLGANCRNCRYLFPLIEGMLDFSMGSNSSEEIASSARHAYESTHGLETRIAFFRTRYRHNLSHGQCLDALNAQTGEILEIGCGTLEPLLAVGHQYQSHDQLWGIDLSLAMLMRARHVNPRARLSRADAAYLPFASGSFGVAWIRHALYHVADIERALGECTRVLDDGGAACITTNSSHNKVEMHDIHKRVLEDLGLDNRYESPDSVRFSSEALAGRMSAHFRQVAVVKYEGYFDFEDADEFLGYYQSTVYFKRLLQRGFDEQQLAGIARRYINALPTLRLSNAGAIGIGTKTSALFDPGQPLQEMKNCIV